MPCAMSADVTCSIEQGSVAAMSTVLLVRHGRSTANAEGILAGRLPGMSLDDTGIEQARRVATQVAELPIARVVASPMERCQQTARLVAPDLEPTPETGLTECDYGTWSGAKLTDLATQELWKTVQQNPSAARFPEGESLREMHARAVDAARTWDARVTDEHGADALWMAVSHGDVIKAIIADALGLHLDLFQRLVVDPASVSIIRYTPQGPQVLGVNITGREFTSLIPKPVKDAEIPEGHAVVGGRDA